MASTVTNLLYHIVFSTKNREPIITSPIRKDLYSYIGGIVRGEVGVLLEIGGVADHVHLVMRLKTEPSVATMVKIVKSKSSKWLNEQPKRPGRFEWQRGYAAFTVSSSQLARVRAYVRNQQEHHRRQNVSEGAFGDTQTPRCGVRGAVPVGLKNPAPLRGLGMEIGARIAALGPRPQAVFLCRFAAGPTGGHR